MVLVFMVSKKNIEKIMIFIVFTLDEKYIGSVISLFIMGTLALTPIENKASPTLVDGF